VQESTHIEDPPVAVRVTRRVKPERVEEFEEWVSGITAATARFPGYLGAEVLKPGDPSDTDYHIIFKFDHMSDLKRWEDSDERRDWCLRVEPLQEGPAHRHVVSGLERWFVLPSNRDTPPATPLQAGRDHLAGDLPADNRRVLLLRRFPAATAARHQDPGGHGDNRAGDDLLGVAAHDAPFHKVALPEGVERDGRSGQRALRPSLRPIAFRRSGG
jgi:heme-degrading monooxygenase HmoA